MVKEYFYNDVLEELSYFQNETEKNINYINNIAFIIDDPSEEEALAFFDLINVTNEVLISANYSTLSNIVDEVMNEYYEGNLTAEQCATQLEEKITLYCKENS